MSRLPLPEWFKERYGRAPDQYEQGVMDATTLLSVWRDGELVTGVRQVPIRTWLATQLDSDSRKPVNS